MLTKTAMRWWYALAIAVGAVVVLGCTQQVTDPSYTRIDVPVRSQWPLARVTRGIVRIKVPVEQAASEGVGYQGSYEIATGIVLDARGTILTCAHAIRNAASGGIRVTPSGSDTSYTATVVQVDEALDLAMLNASMSGLETISIRPATTADCGTTVLMVGFPTQRTYLNHYEPMFASGLLGRIDRTVTARTTPSGATPLLEIQGWVGPGFSGGPVVSSTGEIIGMVMLKVEDNGHWGGYALAVPEQTIRTFLARVPSLSRAE